MMRRSSIIFEKQNVTATNGVDTEIMPDTLVGHAYALEIVLENTGAVDASYKLQVGTMNGNWVNNYASGTVSAGAIAKTQLNITWERLKIIAQGVGADTTLNVYVVGMVG